MKRDGHTRVINYTASGYDHGLKHRPWSLAPGCMVKRNAALASTVYAGINMVFI